MKKLSILPFVLLAVMAAHRPVSAAPEPAVPEPAVSEPAASEAAVSEAAASEAAAGQASQVIEGTITAEPFDLPEQPWEVGDPLTGHFLNVPMPNGIVYHPQELAFFSWFFDENPSLGFDGWYSMAGTFRTPAAACH